MRQDIWPQSWKRAGNLSFLLIFRGPKVILATVWGRGIRYRWKAEVEIYKLCLNHRRVGALGDDLQGPKVPVASNFCNVHAASCFRLKANHSYWYKHNKSCITEKLRPRNSVSRGFTLSLSTIRQCATHCGKHLSISDTFFLFTSFIFTV